MKTQCAKCTSRLVKFVMFWKELVKFKNCTCICSVTCQVNGKITIHKLYLEMSMQKTSHTKCMDIYKG